MSVNGLSAQILDFIKAHEFWAAPVVFVLALCESFAFISLIIPATVILVGVGGLIGLSSIGFWNVWVAACLGAFAGDWIAYELAFWLKDGIANLWPLSRNPELLIKGRRFFQRWGLASVFFSRFFGPMRAVTPLVAGAFGMGRTKFQIANLASAIIWATGVLTPGYFGIRWLWLD